MLKLKTNGTVVLRRSEHPVSRRDIDSDALKVLYRLHRYGHTAYLVGGGVRDLLMGRKPKDFDISTSAHPNEIKRLFRNAFLIGRRFRLAHIRFGRKIIETSTFRKQPEVAEDVEVDEKDLLQRHDNTFGTPEEDAFRRDFTVNGLFYDIKTFDVIDHVGGLKDLDNRIIRSIGDANRRFREDPVRMIRAIRFAARLGFKIERRTCKAILRHHAEIMKAPKSRLLEDIMKLFDYRSAQAAFRLLYETRLLADLFPLLNEFISRNKKKGSMIWRYLEELDSYPQQSEVTAPVRMAALFYAPFRVALEEELESGHPPHYGDIARELLDPVRDSYSLPRRLYYTMIHLFESQRYFDMPRGRFSKKKFRGHDIYEQARILHDIHQAVLDARDEFAD